MRLLRHLAFMCGVLLILLQPLQACSIPVFRYALERWPADLFEVAVFFDGQLSSADMERLNQIEDWAALNGGNANLEVVRCNLHEKVPADLLAVWKSLPSAPQPYVVVRAPRERTKQAIVWQGRLQDAFLDQLSMSPARREVVQRLLKGDAVVWLLLRGDDPELAARTRRTLDETLRQLEEETLLPPGVGQPGSELQSKVPLHVKFSVVEISAKSPEEQPLVALLQGRFKKAPEPSDSLVAPVFGRGRVLEVLSATEVDAESIADLTRYLCGACSCQVKQQNPGFDLPLAMNWEEKLFDDEQIPRSDEPQATESYEAEFVPIPTGSTASVLPLKCGTVSPPPGLARRTVMLWVGGFVGLLVLVVIRKP